MWRTLEKVSFKKEAACSGLELWALENQLRSYVVGERDTKIDVETEAQGVEEALLCLHLVRVSCWRFILSQLKSQDARKR